MMESAWKYKPYPEYKDSGIEWLGEIPKHWELKRIKYCVDLINEKENGSEPDVPYIGLENIEPWTGRYICSESIFEYEGQASTFSNGDVLFGKLRPYLAKVLLASEKGVCTGELLVLRPKLVVNKYLLYFLLTKDFIFIVDSSTYGAKMPRANWSFIGNLSATIPSFSEQQAIASFLDRETARIDELIAKKEQLIALLREKRTALISHAVTKGLNPDAKMKDSGIEWLGEIPEHWNVLSIKHLLQVKDGTHDTPDFVIPSDDTYPLLTSKDLFAGRINFDEAKHISQQDYVNISKRSDSEYGDVLLPMIGTIGNPVIVYDKRPFSIKNIALFKTSKSQIDKRYIYYFLLSNLCSTQFDLLTRGGVQGFVSLFILRNLKLFYMSLDEYRYIADYLDYETAQIDELIKKNYGVIENLQEYRTALISAAVTGKIDVREQI